MVSRDWRNAMPTRRQPGGLWATFLKALPGGCGTGPLPPTGGLKQAARTSDRDFACSLKRNSEFVGWWVVLVIRARFQLHSVPGHSCDFFAIHFDRAGRSQVSKLNLQAIAHKLCGDFLHSAAGIVVKLALAAGRG